MHRGERRLATQQGITASASALSKKQGGAPAHLTTPSWHPCIVKPAKVLAQDRSEDAPLRSRHIMAA